MRIPSIFQVLASAILLQFATSIPVVAADKETKADKHKLSEWKIGSVLFGEKLSKADMKGKVVVIENWGVNCPPCIASLPHLAELDKRNRDKGLLIIGAESQGSSKDAIEPLLKKAKVDYTITSGADGPLEVSTIPRIFVFDRTGAMVFDGRPSDEEFERAVKKALREGDATATKPAATTSGPLIASRSWTNAQGQQIKAAVKSADDTKVVFQMANGKLVDYDLAKLSDESRELIAEAVKAAKGSEESPEEDADADE
jgi:thiol-disulfide isomerase/thioredoxin